MRTDQKVNRERRYVKSSEFLFSFVYVLDAAQGTNREAVGGQKTVKKSYCQPSEENCNVQ